MSRLAFASDHGWRCRLHCARCTHAKANGAACRNRVCMGTPVCWVHTRQLYGAGKGLFTTRATAAGQWICPYGGERISGACLDARYPGDVTAPYAVTTPGGLTYDAACRRGIGSMANSLMNARTGKCRALSLHNARTAVRESMGRQLWLKSTKAVPAGAENFYGDSYRLADDHATGRRRAPDSRPC